MNIVKYITVGGAGTLDLDKAVNELLDQGYQLYGSPYALDSSIQGLVSGGTFSSSCRVFQAMAMDSDTAAKILREEKEVKSRFLPKR